MNVRGTPKLFKPSASTLGAVLASEDLYAVLAAYQNA